MTVLSDVKAMVDSLYDNGHLSIDQADPILSTIQFAQDMMQANYEKVVLLGRVTYFLEFEQGSPVTKRRAMAKKLLDEINNATGGTV